MTMKGIGRTAIVAGCAAWALFGGTAQAATWQNADVVLRDATGDAVRSDGNPMYSGNGDISGISDATQTGSTSDPLDYFYFRPWGKRTFSIQTEKLNGGLPYACTDHDSRISFFSRQTPNWYDQISLLPVGGAVSGDVGGRCFTKGKAADYYIDYPSSEPDPGKEAECVTMRRVTSTTFVLEAPATCLADIYRWETVRGKPDPKLLHPGVSMPFSLTATLE